MQVENGLTGYTIKSYRTDDRARPASAAEYEKHIEDCAGACIRVLTAREDHTAIGERAKRMVIEKYIATSKLKNLLNIILTCSANAPSAH